MLRGMWSGMAVEVVEKSGDRYRIKELNSHGGNTRWIFISEFVPDNDMQSLPDVEIPLPADATDIEVNVIHTSWVKKPMRTGQSWSDCPDGGVLLHHRITKPGVIEISYKLKGQLEVTAYYRNDRECGELRSATQARQYAASVGVKTEKDDEDFKNALNEALRNTQAIAAAAGLPATTPEKNIAVELTDEIMQRIIRDYDPEAHPTTQVAVLQRAKELRAQQYTEDKFAEFHPKINRPLLCGEAKDKLFTRAEIPQSHWDEVKSKFKKVYSDTISGREAFLLEAKAIYASLPRISNYGGKPVHRNFESLLFLLQNSADKNVYIYGPAGTGKTYHAAMIAQVLNLEFGFTGSLDQAYDLIGYKNAQGEYVSTPFRKIFEHGGVFLYDEIDGSAPQPLLKFSAALSNAFMAFPDGNIPRHPDCYIIAAGNTNGGGATAQFRGRSGLDHATLDRFAFLKWPIDEYLEATFTKHAWWLDTVRRCRKLHVENKLTCPYPTPRAVIKGNALIEAGMKDKKQLLEALLVRGDEKARKAYENA